MGRPGQKRIEHYETRSMAVEALETWLQRKCRRGYALRDGRRIAGIDAAACAIPYAEVENAEADRLWHSGVETVL
ncbi:MULTISPECIES: hypothetical protein [Microvirga]|uniref:hypothetical protein n=1 Tax=Microvirga TaxID=186650 RepID=UPI00290564DE|nr:hypothetical protein [Microvirga sp. HBU67655]